MNGRQSFTLLSLHVDEKATSVELATVFGTYIPFAYYIKV